MSKKKRTGRPSKYPPEFQRDAAGIVLDEYLRQPQSIDSGCCPVDERAELAGLRGELRMERDRRLSGLGLERIGGVIVGPSGLAR